MSLSIVKRGLPNMLWKIGIKSAEDWARLTAMSDGERTAIAQVLHGHGLTVTERDIVLDAFMSVARGGGGVSEDISDADEVEKVLTLDVGS